MSELYPVLVLKGLGWLLMACFTFHTLADVAQNLAEAASQSHVLLTRTFATTRCAALQKSKQRFGRPTAFKIVQGVEQDPPDDPEAHGAALSHGVEGRVPENVERAVIKRN